MMPVRILHVVDTLEMGGTERGVVNLIQSLDPSRFEHTVCAIRNVGVLADLLPRERVPVTCLHKKVAGLSFQGRALAGQIRDARPHVVHSRNWGAMEAVVAGKWVGGCAVVHSEHGMEVSQKSREPWRRRCFRRLAYELADEVFAVSGQLRDLHARRTGFPAAKIGVIHNGVDISRYRPQAESRARERERRGISPQTFCIGAIGRLEPVKDQGTLLRAAAALEGGGNWRVLIAGEGSEAARLRQFAGEHPALRGHVRFLGEVHHVPELLSALDVYVLPSLSEGISNSLLEAMAAGLPVVASATGGNPEVVTDGESGLLFPVGDSARLAEDLRRLQEQQELRERLGKRACRRVQERFSMEAMVTKYELLYTRLAEGLSSPAAISSFWTRSEITKG